jgi:hypothetical protein
MSDCAICYETVNEYVKCETCTEGIFCDSCCAKLKDDRCPICRTIIEGLSSSDESDDESDNDSVVFSNEPFWNWVRQAETDRELFDRMKTLHSPLDYTSRTDFFRGIPEDIRNRIDVNSAVWEYALFDLEDDNNDDDSGSDLDSDVEDLVEQELEDEEEEVPYVNEEALQGLLRFVETTDRERTIDQLAQMCASVIYGRDNPNRREHNIDEIHYLERNSNCRLMEAYTEIVKNVINIVGTGCRSSPNSRYDFTDAMNITDLHELKLYFIEKFKDELEFLGRYDEDRAEYEWDVVRNLDDSAASVMILEMLDNNRQRNISVDDFIRQIPIDIKDRFGISHDANYLHMTRARENENEEVIEINGRRFTRMFMN